MVEVEIEQPLANILIEAASSSSTVEVVCNDGVIDLVILDRAEEIVDEEVAPTG